MENYEKYVGQIFDNRYKIENLIGVGGMAVVYKALDMLMRRIVAVKILKDDMATDEPSVMRFINESKAVAMLSHPNIVNIYDVSVRDNVKYIVMEYIEGITLKSYITRRQVLSFKEVVGYSIQILKALEHAHQKGIVHRDIKPQNIMLLKSGVIKVMDFGIAKLPNTDTVTMSDKAIGTVYYISPEQASGEVIDARSDLYSLGAMMYEMSTGSLPFDAESPVSVALMQVNDTPAAPREVNSHIPEGLEQIIMKAMEKDPNVRYQSASQMLAHLIKLRENPNIIFKPSAADKIKKFFSSKFRKKKKGRTMFPMIMGVFTSFLIVFVIAGLFIFNNVFNSSSQVGYETITVENFAGSVFSDELKEWFEKSEYYTVADVEYRYSGTVPQGTIIEQSPSEGVRKKVQRGKKPCKIKLVVSGGEQKLTLGDFSVRDYRLVVSELRALGLVCSVEKVYDDSIEIGYVVATDPESGTVVESGDTVVLFVSRGPEEGDIAVPDLIGKTEAEALILLSKMRLSVGNVIYERSDKDSGTILSQSILPDTMVTAHTPIDLNVSGGPRYGRGAADDDSGDSDSDGSEPDSGTPITLSPIDEITVTSETKNKDPAKTSSSSGSDEPSSDSESESESETETEDTESESDGGEETPERDDG
ncbi:MAG: protein kinase [Clostridia bacterium]|nr:protein kinase [Clostridia bacterium]